MSLEKLTGDLAYQLIGTTDSEGQDLKFMSYDEFGEIFVKTPAGHYFKLTVEPIDAESCDHIDEEDWT